MRVHAPRGRQPADSCIYPGATRNLFRRPAHALRILTNCRSSSRTNTESKQTLDELRGALQEAIRAEDYVVAAELRDIIRQKEKENPLVKLQEELRTAIADERYVSHVHRCCEFPLLPSGPDSFLVSKIRATSFSCRETLPCCVTK